MRKNMNKWMWLIVSHMLLLLLGINMGRKWAPKSAAVEELVFRAYIMGCVESVPDVRQANQKCADKAVRFQSDIKEILDQ